MRRIRQLEQAVVGSRRLPALVIALGLAVLAGVVILATLQARERIREQIAGRDGEVLHAVASLNYAEDVRDGLAGQVLNPGDQLGIAIKGSQLRDVLGVRLFDPKGRFVESFPPYVTENEIPQAMLPALKALRPISHFHPRFPMDELFYQDATDATGMIPVLEVIVPLHTADGPLAGIAQFLVAGHSIQAEFARLDGHLTVQALLAFIAGGTILTVALAWAFRRVRRSQRLLTERTENLVRANQELALAARTSALGAVAAHLIHGLRNPLAGLQNFMAARGASPDDGGETEWDQAVASTRRMQALINQVVGVLREEHGGTGYEVTLAELEQIVRNRIQPLARDRGVNFTTLLQTEAALPNRAANLVALILVNLVENAVQATPGGKAVTLAARREDERLVFEVRDAGAGFPADTPMFTPCVSSKEGGTGIGLALGKQLANHLGAELDLAASTTAGCIFALKLPAACEAKPTAATERS